MKCDSVQSHVINEINHIIDIVLLNFKQVHVFLVHIEKSSDAIS